MNINELLRKLLRKIFRLINYGLTKNKYYNKSYSQEGEDILLNKLFFNKNNGFYVDIGAHHPKKYSNTYLLYRKGWRGINIDPRPGMAKLFAKNRGGDINLEIGISLEEINLDLFVFKEEALNTFSDKMRDLYISYGHELVEKRTIVCKRLDNIFDIYLPANSEIDLLSIDTEGYEMQVLTSNNWLKYKPSIILIEVTTADYPQAKSRYDMLSIENAIKTDTSKYLISLGYKFYMKTYNTLFFILD